MSNYYNEHDPFAAAWLRELIADKHIPDGVVDERDIQSVVPADLVGFTQCHFFAGIGGWSLALRLAGFPEDREIWTGSCPCQPFSVAGAGAGHTDERHLWPEFFRLVAECRPVAVLGEQVEAAIRHGWLDLVQTDLEGIGYACGAVVLPAAGVGAPHIRSRLWFVGERMADADGRNASAEREQRGGEQRLLAQGGGGCPLADAERRPAERSGFTMGSAPSSVQGEARQWQRVRADAWDGRDVDWIACRDGKSRPIPTEPTLFPLAHGIPNRMGILRGAGNAIAPEVAAEVIRAWQS